MVIVFILIICLCRIIQDYVVREDGYTLRPATTSAHCNTVTYTVFDVTDSANCH